MLNKKIIAAAFAVAFTATGLTGCSQPENNTVTIATHDSFVISDELKASFEKKTGLKLTVVQLGDAGSLTNKLVLTKDDPVADAYFGIDNTFLSRAQDAGVLKSSEEVDFGDVCLNYDKYWFRDHSIAAPTDLADLVKTEYKGLTVLENPATSSPGLAFLATTVAEFGDPGYEQYWQELKANDVKLAASWDDAYFVDFSGSSGKGSYPIVLSYSTSPAYEVRDDGQPQTAAVLNKCFRQFEYAGVLTNAKHPNNAQKLVDFLKSEEFQNSIAESMYVYPSVLYPKGVPADWTNFGVAADSTIGENLNIGKDRDNWIKTVTALFG
ncbi:MAG: thiamine ABC transporter substrate binding subunit [Micrococcales bacterium]